MKSNKIFILSIISRVIFPPTLLLILLYVSFYLHFLPSYEEDMIKEKKEAIVALTQVTASMVDHYYQNTQSTHYSHGHAKQNAIEALRSLRYGPKGHGYFWLIDTKGHFIMHPNQTELEGRHLSEIVDKKGNAFLTPMSEVTIKKGHAFTSYTWQKNTNDPKRYPKLSYSVLYKRWDWIIGTGVYTDDIQEGITIRKKRFQHNFITILLLALILCSILIFFGIKRERQLVFLEQQAQTANRAKRLFMAKVGHELRTPLNQIWGVSAQLKAGENQIILQRATKMLLGHIDDITTYVSIDEQTITPYFETISINELRGKIIELWWPLCLQRKVALETFTDSYEIKSFVNDFKLIIIVLNSLISNSIKFSTNNNRIKVSVKQDGPNLITFTVEDHGIGISDKRKNKVWEEFTQIDEELDRRYQGLGIGLPLAKKIIETLNGTIDYSSSDKQTTKFFFSIPSTKITSMSDNIEIQPKTDDTSPIKVLMVDDDESNRMLLGSFLKKINVKYVDAVDGVDAVEKFQKEEFDLVLMDIQMPRLDGLEASKSIRKWEKEQSKRPTPIVAVSAFTSNEAKLNTVEAGMCNFLEKPVLKNKLNDIVLYYTSVKKDGRKCNHNDDCCQNTCTIFRRS